MCTALGLQGLAFWRAGESGQGIGANSSTWYGLACSAHLRASEARHSCCSRNAPIWGARAWMMELLKSERQCSRRACMVERSAMQPGLSDLSTKGPRNLAKRTELCLFRACGPGNKHRTTLTQARRANARVSFVIYSRRGVQHPTPQHAQRSVASRWCIAPWCGFNYTGRNLNAGVSFAFISVESVVQ